MKTSFIVAVLSLFASVSSATAGSPEPLLKGGVVVIAIAKVKPGTEKAFQASADQILAPTRAEDGNLSYEYTQSIDDPTEFAFVEHWKSQEVLATHLNLPHMQEFFKEVGPLFETGYPQIKTYHPTGK